MTLIALSRDMQDVSSIVSRVADTEAPVFIQGESGTGKEVVARAIHSLSRNPNGPFIAVNCSALPANLLESELFGHEKGAFTGATSTRKGLLEEAHDGTFFFDEITEMDVGMQAKLLRVLQEKKLRRVGGNREIEFNVRVLSASNRNPQKAVSEKRLREDLFFRLGVVTIVVPPLRNRREDIPSLANLFLHEIASAYGRNVQDFTPQVMERFMAYSWPGNVRELRNVIERAVSLATRPMIREADLPESLSKSRIRQVAVEYTEPYDDAKSKVLDQFQQEYFTALLAEENNNISRVAARAKVDRKTIYRILKNYGLESRADDESGPVVD
jgi:transcriptional regulator with PAS, ATPase and Fis domain